MQKYIDSWIARTENDNHLSTSIQVDLTECWYAVGISVRVRETGGMNLLLTATSIHYERVGWREYGDEFELSGEIISAAEGSKCEQTNHIFLTGEFQKNFPSRPLSNIRFRSNSLSTVDVT